MPGDGTRLIHRLLVDPADDFEQVCGYGWIDLNPECLVTTWDLSCLRDFPQLSRMAERFRGTPGGEVMLSLAVGVALVEQWGGVWVRSAVEPLKPLPRFPLHDAWVVLMPPPADDSISVVALGAPYPHHEFWTSVLRELPECVEKAEDADPCMALISSFAVDNPAFVHILPEAGFVR